MAPNATRILKDWGCNLEDLQPVHCNKMRLWDHQGNLMHIPVVGAFLKGQMVDQG